MNEKKFFSLKQYSPRVLVREELIEVKIARNTGSPKTKIQLPDNQNLRNTHLLSIETFDFSVMPKSIVTQSIVLSEALLKSCFITLQAYNGQNFVWQDPLITYKTMGTVLERNPHVFAQQKVNYPKSYIEIADSSLISSEEDQVLPLRIFYRYFDKVERESREASFKKQS
jgi:hypothetical protein